jgi:hypothetical protein
MRAQSKVRRRYRSQEHDVVQLLHRLASNCKDPARFIELFYWSSEPELMEIVRKIIALPDEAKGTLHAFFRLAESDLRSVVITVNENGGITLSSPAVAGLLDVIDASAKDKSTQPLH